MKIKLKELYKTKITQLVIGSKKYKAQVYIELDLKNNNIEYLLFTEKGVKKYKYLRNAVKELKAHQINIDQEYFRYSCGNIRNTFIFNNAIKAYHLR